ncbi:MAG: succinate dehydrogenase cytochrome b subunit [Phocaeicola sp.]|uniref:succinate dehydrogenase cytochrome b subunit n=1 Tax=Phocaeicola TaxID=909656 RepID=UPI00234F8622|nr:succinate dehydrogenase cytochrome b subunit [Phocaeicola oris]MCE2617481.1 succinate dehydrogenase cytochrome b subunit [Phocaeicola oris]
MWLSNSSIGRKVVMSVTGIALILFLTFHLSMNLVAIFSESAYNMICEFLGANWYAVVGTICLAALAVIHIIYAFWLTIQNRAARGSDRYAVTARPEGVEWASKNMLVLGIIIALGLILHLFNFWYNMMFQELVGNDTTLAANGAYWIKETFHNPVYVILYVIWLVALWFHLTHGFWSAIQTFGWNNKIWMKRWEVISKVYTTILIAGFLAVIFAFVACR